ncbi:NUDIX hydrolase [Neorhizobium sp. P12A]|uniref:NUDIX hydrolase n=1 Tax=Neorhizobium sp. P12A TaxID=2268027 RepID=UPI0011EC499E|nr:NUDIX hydrolase [Neorhizobium sp. P12A]KAA0698396.1 NUDIX hydrolase [Neorhizobium sp. P12A]
MTGSQKQPSTAYAGSPRDAAALILIDRSADKKRVLLGRRASGHAFMPDLYVFPGGRRDPRDHSLPFAGDLHPLVTEKLLAARRRPMTATGARALALAAIRELREETGLRIRSGLQHADAAEAATDLSALRYVARAITPPGHPRRYDTRFFLTFTDEADINPSHIRDSQELLDLQWLDMSDISCLNMPDITRIILGDVIDLMKADPSPGFGSAVPFYVSRRGRFVRHML